MLPLVPMSFQGGTHLHPILVPQVPGPSEGVLPSSPRWGVSQFQLLIQGGCQGVHLWSGLDGSTPSGLDWSTPIGTGLVYTPPVKTGLEYLPGWTRAPSPIRRGGGTPYFMTEGVPAPSSKSGWHSDRLCRGRYAFCGFPQEDCLVVF